MGSLGSEGDIELGRVGAVAMGTRRRVSTAVVILVAAAAAAAVVVVEKEGVHGMFERARLLGGTLAPTCKERRGECREPISMIKYWIGEMISDRRDEVLDLSATTQ